MVEYFSKFADACVAMYRKTIDSIEAVIGYTADKLKKVITIRDIAFLLIGSGGASFIAWQIYAWYASHSVQTGTIVIAKIVYKLVIPVTGGN